MEEIKAYFKTKYPHLSEIDITMLENQAKETWSRLSEHRKRNQGSRGRWTSELRSRMNQGLN